MWIFLNDAFLSVVAQRDRPNHLLVRARIKGDIQRALRNAGSKITVRHTPEHDYQYRTVVPRSALTKAMTRAVAGIKYDNFKALVVEADREVAYTRVWSVMAEFADRREKLRHQDEPKSLRSEPETNLKPTLRKGQRKSRAKHYVAMAGLRHHFPQYASGHRTMADAAAALAHLHKLNDEQEKALIVGEQLSLSLKMHGNEYAVVKPCECDEPHYSHYHGHESSLPDDHGYQSEMVAYRKLKLHNPDIKIADVIMPQGKQDADDYLP